MEGARYTKGQSALRSDDEVTTENRNNEAPKYRVEEEGKSR
jgi:hypothetical protein